MLDKIVYSKIPQSPRRRATAEGGLPLTGCRAGAKIENTTAILSYPHIPESSIAVGDIGKHPPGVLSRVAASSAVTQK